MKSLLQNREVPGVGLASAAGNESAPLAYQFRPKPENGQCLDCGASIEVDRFGRVRLWRCAEDPGHTGMWDARAEWLVMQTKFRQRTVIGSTGQPKAILDVLRKGPATTAEISEQLGLPRENVSSQVSVLCKAGRVRKLCIAPRVSRNPRSLWGFVK